MQTTTLELKPAKFEPIKFERFQATQKGELQERIVNARKKLGSRLVILGHHYQQESVYRHADLTGDSLKLSRHAAEVDAEYIVFLGVHFMSHVVCECSTMARIDPQHLAWTLENLAAGNVVNQIKVLPQEATLAKLALQRMLDAS